MQTATKTKGRDRAALVGRKKARSTKLPQALATENLSAAQPTAAQLQLRIAAVVLVGAAGLWAYWPTLCELVVTWAREPDYSHGFLVIPLAAYFLYSRRDSCPGITTGGSVLGCLLLGASLALRYLSGRFFMGFLDAWSIVPWIAAVVALLGGRRLLWWCAPSLGFLWFMVPLPFSLEGLLSLPLQRIATKLSYLSLQTIGLPAFAEGNVIVVGESRLEVAQACSGLRLFLGVLALAYAYAVLVRRSWWERLLVLASAVPIAVVANVARIVLTGLLFQLVSSKEAQHLAHDFAGWAMIPIAASLFWLFLWYYDRLFAEEEVMDMAELVREAEL